MRAENMQTKSEKSSCADIYENYNFWERDNNNSPSGSKLNVLCSQKYKQDESGSHNTCLNKCKAT